MSRLIVKQPNGLYACWSTIIDDFIATDLTKHDYIKMRADEAYISKIEEMEVIFVNIESGRHTKDYKECLEIIKGNEGFNYNYLL